MPVAAGLFYFSSGTDNLLRPPAVLIHGAGGDHLFWPPQIRRLDGQRVLAPDLPGHGKSPGLAHHTVSDYADAVVEFLEAINLNSAVIVGHSMGGAIALDIAARFPRRVLGLGLMGTGAKLRVAPDLLRGTAQPPTFPAAIRQLTDLSFSPQAESRLKDLATRRLAETRPAVLHGDLLACDAFDARAQLSRIQAPVLIVCGAADRMTPPAYSTYLRQHIPLARLELVPAAGHMVMLEKPEAVAGLLDDFLDSISYRPGG